MIIISKDGKINKKKFETAIVQAEQINPYIDITKCIYDDYNGMFWIESSNDNN